MGGLIMRVDGVLSVNNIFRYATSELSQDAFICWLLSYATEDGWNKDSQLRECAIVFMGNILESKGSYWHADMRINAIRRQYKNIDILVDGKYEEKLTIPKPLWRGSNNQRIIDVKETLRLNKVVTL